MRAVLIDLDGVVYQGDQVVRGAAEAIGWLRAEAIPFLFVTNTTSRPRVALVEKLAHMGIPSEIDDFLTPPLAALRWLEENAPGPAALFVPPATVGEFASLPQLDGCAEAGAASVVLGDLGSAWDFDGLNRAFRLLMAEPTPVLVALGMTRYWRAADGLRLDVAPFVVALEHATGRAATVLGKPAAPFFETAARLVDRPPHELVMIGDDIVGDVRGAQLAGIKGVLVRTGKYRGTDLGGDIEPDAILDSIHDLRRWWERESH